MTDKELLEAAKAISENCEDRHKCEGCPFWNNISCMLRKPVRQWGNIMTETSNKNINVPCPSLKKYYAHIDDKSKGWISVRFFATDLQDIERQVRDYFSKDNGKIIVIQHRNNIVLRLQIS